METGGLHRFNEQWFVVQSLSYANTQKKACLGRIEKAEAELGRLKPKKDETTERLLAQFEGLHLLIEQTQQSIRLRLIEDLNPLQLTILTLLELSPIVYDLSSDESKFKDSS